MDPAPQDPSLCGDVDGDTCDDCSVGTDGFGPLPDFNTADDGPDFDVDGLCDAGDADDDNDGIDDGVDPAPQDPSLCGDADADTCDDCTIGTDGIGPLPDFDTADDGPDFDVDGLCDAGDADDDNDGVDDATSTRRLRIRACAATRTPTAATTARSARTVSARCRTSTRRTTARTSTRTVSATRATRTTTTTGSTTRLDSAPHDPTACQDLDADGCDDCSVGTDGIGPLSGLRHGERRPGLRRGRPMRPGRCGRRQRRHRRRRRPGASGSDRVCGDLGRGRLRRLLGRHGRNRPASGLRYGERRAGLRPGRPVRRRRRGRRQRRDRRRSRPRAAGSELVRRRGRR